MRITPRDRAKKRQLKHSRRWKLWLEERQQIVVFRMFWIGNTPTIKETYDYPLND